MDSAIHAIKRGEYDNAIHALSKHATEASRIIHLDTITPVDALPQVNRGPQPVVLGTTVVGMHFGATTDKAYRIVKIPSNYIGDASFHLHWTKNVNTNQQNATVRWRLSYLVFDGSSTDVTAAATQIEWDVVYASSGTTSRVVYRTPNAAAVGFVAGYYVGVMLEYVSGSTTLSGGPVALSADLLMRVTINSDGT